MSVKQQRIFWIIVVLLILVLFVSGYFTYLNKKDLVYRNSLEMEAVTVDGESLTMRDMAYYIAKEELEIEAQARVYDPENTKKYWALRLKGIKFIKVDAKEYVMNAAIHDQIFYRLAIEQEIALDAEAERLIELYCEDFWNDLETQGQDILGVSKEDVLATMHRIALGEKYQNIYTLEQMAEQEAYDVDGEAYQKLLKEHKYKVNQKNWKRIPFGNILVHNETME